MSPLEGQTVKITTKGQNGINTF